LALAIGANDELGGGGDKLINLKDFDGRRDNNFTLLRTVFALTVLVGHSYPITGNGSDPLTLLLLPNTWIGELAVGGFFAISGFLVTASFERRGPLAFIVSRLFRLYPAVIVYCLLAVFVIGPLGTTIPAAQYFQSSPWSYMWNATLWTWQVNLPYSFLDRPFGGATNGSTWTLPIELRSYMLILLMGIIGVWRRRLAANLLLLALMWLVLYGPDLAELFDKSERYRGPMLFLLIGCAAWVNRQWIPLTLPLLVFAAVSPFLAAGTAAFFPVHAVCLVYAILYLAFRAPHVDIDRLGDLSYGIYIYAWPVQQLVWTPGQSGISNAVIATIVVLPVAYLSWVLVEKPAMRLRARRRGVLPETAAAGTQA
jgi:peptidoglycan/LPS O-acetylase OafA/YrhL